MGYDMGYDLTTQDGVVNYMLQSKDREDWNLRCDTVKGANDGYPSFWFRAIVTSGLADRVLGQGASKITIAPLEI